MIDPDPWEYPEDNGKTIPQKSCHFGKCWDSHLRLDNACALGPLERPEENGLRKLPRRQGPKTAVPAATKEVGGIGTEVPWAIDWLPALLHWCMLISVNHN